MYVEILKEEIEKYQNIKSNVQKEIDIKKSKLKELNREEEANEAKIKKYDDYDPEVKFWVAYIIAFLIIASFLILLVYKEAGGIDFQIALIILAVSVFYSFMLAWILKFVLTLLVKLFLIGKIKKAKKLVKQYREKLANNRSDSRSVCDDLNELYKEINSCNENIDSISSLIPAVNDYEKALALMNDVPKDVEGVYEIFSLLKSSTDEFEDNEEATFEKVYELMIDSLEKFKKSIESMDDGNALAAIAQKILPEDHEYALKLIEKAFEMGSEGGKVAVKIVLDKCEEMIYASDYDNALAFLTPLRNYGNSEAKLLWQKANDFKKQEEIAKDSNHKSSYTSYSQQNSHYTYGYGKLTTEQLQEYNRNILFDLWNPTKIDNDPNLTAAQKIQLKEYNKIYGD